MLNNILLIIVGLGVLLVAGDVLVRGAVSLASKLNIPTLIISLTIVAFGTSAPEFVVTLQDVLSGGEENGIAMGNIIGSNIANILLVLGLPAILYPIALNAPGCRRHAAVMLVATAVFTVFAMNGAIDLMAGIALMSIIIVYVTYIGIRAKGDADNADLMLDEVEEYAEGDGAAWKIPLFLIAGLVGLPVGAHLLVQNGSIIAAEVGIREEIIGLTIVAFGTSLPELATVVAAALKKHADVAVGNIVGSNIFNLLFVGGAAGLAGTSSFTDAALKIDIPFMILSTVVLSVLIFMKSRINRVLGAGMAASYLAYIVFLGAKSGLI